MSECPNCGAIVEATDSFCRACGAQLSEGEAPLRSATVDQLIHEYRRQIVEHPDDDSARYALGLAYLYHGQLTPAREQFEEVTRLAPQFADAYAKLAIVHSRLGQLDEAREAIRQAMKLDTTQPEYRDIADKLDQLA